MLSAWICIPMIPVSYRFTPHLPHTHPGDWYAHTHTPSPNHCHYKSQQLLHALIVNHNCLSIFPHLFNVAVRDSMGKKRGRRGKKKLCWDMERGNGSLKKAEGEIGGSSWREKMREKAIWLSFSLNKRKCFAFFLKECVCRTREMLTLTSFSQLVVIRRSTPAFTFSSRVCPF